MKRLNAILVTSAFACAAIASAQTPQNTTGGEQEADQQQQQSPASQDTRATPGTVNPLPSTSPTEGTAADRTPPGQTRTPGQTPSSEHSSSNTSSANAASGDSSSSDRTRVATASTARGHSVSQLIGASVQGTGGEAVGTVQDIVIDDSGKVAAMVVQSSGSSSSAGQGTSIPWSAVRSVEPDGKVTVDSSSMSSVQQR
jgi:sporulation protein YlmC with PRC-barrel domain